MQSSFTHRNRPVVPWDEEMCHAVLLSCWGAINHEQYRHHTNKSCFLYRDQQAYLEKLGHLEALVKRYCNVFDYSAANIRFEDHWGDKILVRDCLLITDKANTPVAISEYRNVINGNPNAVICGMHLVFFILLCN